MIKFSLVNMSAFTNALLFVSVVSLANYQIMIAQPGGRELFLLSFVALINVALVLKLQKPTYAAYSIMALGTSFTFLAFHFVHSNYVGSVWLVHIFLFAYYFLPFRAAIRWSVGALLFYALYVGLSYFGVIHGAYNIAFMFSQFFALSIALIAMLFFGFMIEDIEEDREAKAQELKDNYDLLQRSQKKLIESEKMSALGALVSGVAHEVNTPIGISLTAASYIASETQMLKKALHEETLGKNALDEYFHTMDALSKTMVLSLNNAAQLVRSFKQVAVDQHSDNRRIFNLHSYINDIAASQHSHLKNHHVRISNHIGEDIELDNWPGAFFQIFNNFIDNSLKHGHRQDEPIEIDIDGGYDGDELLIVYKDNGVGIAPEHIDKVFEPFFTTALGSGGSGLGMNICYNLITQKMQGEVAIESQLGSGVVINIRLPKRGMLCAIC